MVIPNLYLYYDYSNIFLHSPYAFGVYQNCCLGCLLPTQETLDISEAVDYFSIFKK